MEKYLINLKDYKIVQRLGIGGFGEVFLVENTITKNQYAAKVSIKDSSNHEDQIIFINEVDKFIEIKNPAILRFIGFSLSNFSGEPYPTIIIDYMSNGSLYEILDKSRHTLAPHEWTKTKQYINLLGIALGMKYLHSQNIVQRDLKPSNVLLDENFYPHISDFGYSKQLDQLNSSNLMKSGVGTIMYTAPEIMTGNEYNYKVDVYAYSLVAYEIITSKIPFSELTNAFQFIREVPNGKRPDTSMITNELHLNFLEKCWSNNPDERPTFDTIVSTLKNKEFISTFDADIDEVNDYIELFSDEGVDQITSESATKTEKVSSNPPPFQIKLVLVGDPNTQKSTMINSFLYREKDTENRTIGIDFHVKKVHTEFGDCLVQIWDTAGQEKFHSLLPFYFRNSDGVIIVIDVTIEGNFESLKKWFNMINQNGNISSIYIAVKNLFDDSIINMKTIETFANQHNCLMIPFSIDNYKSIDSLFNKVILDIIKKGKGTTAKSDNKIIIETSNDTTNNSNCSVF